MSCPGCFLLERSSDIIVKLILSFDVAVISKFFSS